MVNLDNTNKITVYSLSLRTPFCNCYNSTHQHVC